jgi:CHAT domain-containing protein/predicted negative regulator of RcsB-dependent stress response
MRIGVAKGIALVLPILRTGLLASCLAIAAAPAVATSLAPSADPVNQFIVVADSVVRSGDEALAVFIRDNEALLGASVAQLLNVAFDVAADNAAGAKENVDFARRLADACVKAGGSSVPRGLVATHEGWTPAQRKSRAQAIDLEAQAAAARKAGEIDKAVSLLEQARAIYEKIGDRHAVALNWGTTGLTRWTTGDWPAITADYEQALAARRAVEDRILEGRTLNGLGTTHQQMRDFPKAIDYYRLAIDLRRKTGDLPGLGTSLTYLGHVYNTEGRFVDARNYYEEALPILESMGNAQQMVELLSGIAILNQDMGRAEDANDAYRRAIALATANDLGAAEALCRRNLAEGYRRQGRYIEALDEVEKAVLLLAANPNPDEEALAYLTRGTTAMNMGELDNAREDLLRCTELAKASQNSEVAILAQLNIGHLYGVLASYDRGLKAADHARELAEQAGNPRLYREAMALRGNLLLRLRRYDESLAAWQEALAQDEADQAADFVLVDRATIAAVLAGRGDLAQARAQLHDVIPQARAAGRSDIVWLSQLAMGHSFETESADSAAFYYESALAGIEGFGGGAGDADAQTGLFSAERRYYYEEVTRFYAQTHLATKDPAWLERAFHTIERAKARGLLELLQERVAEHTSPEEAKVLDALYSLDPAGAEYANERAALETRYADLRRARVRAQMGALADGPAIVGIDAVARELPGKTLLLEYALGDSASFLWIVDRKSREVVQLPARPVVEAEVRKLRDALSRMDAGEAALLAAARNLYTMLVAPAAARVAKAETAIIVPDGVLFELPFEVLLASDPAAGAAWSEQPFFARDVATLYAPSATVYHSLKSREGDRKYGLELFAAGNPDFAALDPRGATPLAPLPFADEEVAAIGARVKDSKKRIVTGADATETVVKQELRNGSPRVVHLATHGLVDATEPGRSSVALTPGGDDDGYFHTLEILATPTHSGLVVMSACESARGKVSRGEGVVGLSRAFLAAGAESVVASLWAVSDESTAELMKAFYEQMLGKKKSASRSLNEARLALIESGTYSHPFYWSPFIVTGTERSPW